jgi:hypothetical protein
MCHTKVAHFKLQISACPNGYFSRLGALDDTENQSTDDRLDVTADAATAGASWNVPRIRGRSVSAMPASCAIGSPPVGWLPSSLAW